MISLSDFKRIVELLDKAGLDPAGDINWSENCKMPTNPTDFALEVIYVICNSGMRHSVAVGIYRQVRKLLLTGNKVKGQALGKSGKADAIDDIWARRERLFAEFSALQDDQAKVDFLGALPWIGHITKYHAAKNFGVDCAKPDVHLDRLARAHATTPQVLCRNLAEQTGYFSRTIDLILWRACANGIIDSTTGTIA